MANSPPQIGFLVPLNNNLEEDISIPKLSISQGSNFVGRNSIPLSDKRLSRKHLNLIASSDSSAHLIVEGTNPIVIRSQDQRRKILSRERVKIKHGDIIELIPGHYYFKYETMAPEKNSSSPSEKRERTPKESSEPSASEMQSVKRKKQVSDDEALARNLQSELYDDNLARDNSLEAIRHFNVPNEQLPSTFRLMRVKGLPAWANTSSVSIGDVIEGTLQKELIRHHNTEPA